MALSSEQLQTLRDLLERERARLVRRLKRRGTELGASSDASGFSQHMAEQAAALTERETAFLMASQEGRRLVEVNQALDRLFRRPQHYASCRSCGEEISFERLEALPAADLCIDCKREEERVGGGRE